MKQAMLVVWVLGMVAGCKSQPRTEREQPADWPSVAQAAIPPGAVRVTIDRYEIDQRDRTAIQGAISYRDHNVSVTAGRMGGPNGMLVFAATKGVHALLRVSRDSRYRRTHSSQFIVMDAGRSGSLQALSIQPRPWAVVIDIFGTTGVIRTINELVLGSGFHVSTQPTDGGAVTVTLTPYFNRFKDRDVIRVDEVATALTMQSGVPYVIMHDETRRKSITTALLSHTAMDQNRQVIIVLQVDVGR